MAQFYWGNLKDATSRPAVANKPIYASDHNAWRADVRRRIQELNDWSEAHDTHQSGTSRLTPSTRGRIEADTTTTGEVMFYGDPDGLGADDDFATRLRAQDISFATGGTATFKLGGAIDVNTTQGSGGTVTVSIPANTLSSDGSVLLTTHFQSLSAGSETVTAEFGNPTLFQSTTIQGTGAVMKTVVLRTGASSQKLFAFVKSSSDGVGTTDLVQQGTASLSLAALVTMTFRNQSGGNPEITITKLAS